jgi:hypothetical protein
MSDDQFYFALIVGLYLLFALTNLIPIVRREWSLRRTETWEAIPGTRRFVRQR